MDLNDEIKACKMAWRGIPLAPDVERALMAERSRRAEDRARALAWEAAKEAKEKEIADVLADVTPTEPTRPRFRFGN